MRYYDRMLNRIKKLRAKEFGVYAAQEDDGAPRVCLLAEFNDLAPFMLLMTAEAAHAVGGDLLSAVLALKPEVILPRDLAKQYQAGELSLEDLKARI